MSGFRAWDIDANEFVDDVRMDGMGNFYQLRGSELWGDDRRILVDWASGVRAGDGAIVHEGDLVEDDSSYAYGSTLFVVRFGDYDNDLLYEDRVAGTGWYLEALNARKWAAKSGWIVSMNDVVLSRVVGNVHQNPEMARPC